MIGQTTSHYRIIEKLGGGMGDVYHAQDQQIETTVAFEYPISPVSSERAPRQLCDGYYDRILQPVYALARCLPRKEGCVAYDGQKSLTFNGFTGNLPDTA